MNEKNPKIEKISPFIKEYNSIDNLATVYICDNHSCRTPTTNINEMIKFLGINQ
jgi:hypothetical protein